MRIKIGTTLFLGILLLGCHTQHHGEKQGHHADKKDKTDHDVAWSYEGATGPEHWGHLSPDYALCKDGQSQSPIDIVATAEGTAELDFNYVEIPLKIIDTGRTIDVIGEGGGSLSVAGQTFDLVQFHHRSEHMVAGKDYDMTVHLVHANSDGQLAVVGVFLAAGQSNPFIQTLWDALPDRKNEVMTIEGVTIDPAQLLPESPNYYAYSGSLTTPRCSENVRWHVMTNPIELSEEQIATFAAIYPNNRRPVQPLNGRAVTLHQ